MKFTAALPLLAALQTPSLSCHAAFIPRPVSQLGKIRNTNRFSRQQRLSMAADPSSFHDIPMHLESLQHAFSSFLLSDESVSAAADAVTSATAAFSSGVDTATSTADTVTSAADAVTSAASAVDSVSNMFDVVTNAATNTAEAVTTAATNTASSASGAASSVSSAVSDAATAAAPASDAAVVEAASDNGWFGFLTVPIEGLLQIIHSIFVGAGLGANTWGLSILALTTLIKLLTYPLTKSQLESTNKMQAIQPVVKDIQTKYQSNPEVMNKKIAELYQTEKVNPLAGCLPAIVQLPVFIGLYRAVLTLAKDDVLNEPFLWLPNLEGPTYGADPTAGADWILKGWVDGTPSLGWPDTIAFLSLPVFLVISQYYSQSIMQPKTADGQEPEGNAVLKFLPLLIGWFSINVPAALGIYWVANNIITTAITLQIRGSMETAPAMGGGGASASSTVEEPSKIFQPAPLKEKPSGFAPPPTDPEEIKPITPIDAEVVESKTTEEKPVEVVSPSPEASSEKSNATPSSKPSKKRGGKKKKKGKK